MKYDDIRCLEYPLPETVAKEKWSGGFTRARRLIWRLLADETVPDAMKLRLKLELVNLDYIQQRYTVTPEEGLRLIREKRPDFTADDLEELRTSDRADWMYIDGEVRYIDNFHRTLFLVYPEEKAEKTVPETAAGRMIASLSDGEEMGAHIHIRHELKICDQAVRPGRELTVHLPVPVERGSVSSLRLTDMTEGGVLPAAESLQPTVCFRTRAEEGQRFFVEYSFDNKLVYRDMVKACEGQKTAAADQEPPDETKSFLLPQPPHMSFTPYLRALCAEITKGCDSALLRARRIYDYITTKTDYRFMRHYCSVDNLSEYCAVNRRGDCGVQSLMFITLCRIAGIPAVWQSGIDAKPSDVGEHDWARFYIEGFGWLYADLSYGGAAYRRGDKKSWNFYFGNVDPFRIPINDGFQQEFDIPKKHWRVDPYDNQGGEAEYDDRGLGSREFEYDYIEIDIHEI